MTTSRADAPLFVRLELTPEQQRAIWEQTGHRITAIPLESNAASLRVRFAGLELEIPRGVFAPTPSSERTFELARDALAEAIGDTPGGVVADIGTGAGAIAFALARAFPQAAVYGTDISTAALRAARRNRARLGLRNVRFASGSLLSPLPHRLRGNVDVVVANVPYLPPDRSLEASRAFPQGTAVGLESDGLGLVREVIREARNFLRPSGSLVLQVADFQWAAVSRAAIAMGYANPTVEPRREPGPVAGRLVFSSTDSC